MRHVKNSSHIIYSALNNFRCFIYALFANSWMDLLLLLRKHHILHVTHITACTKPQKIVYMTTGYWVKGNNNTVWWLWYSGMWHCDILVARYQHFDQSSYLLQFQSRTLLPPQQWGSRFLQNVGTYYETTVLHIPLHHHLDIHHSENIESQDKIKCRSDALLWNNYFSVACHK
jgi:hypothetical protein